LALHLFAFMQDIKHSFAPILWNENKKI